jgi:hypothetical protein
MLGAEFVTVFIVSLPDQNAIKAVFVGGVGVNYNEGAGWRVLQLFSTLLLMPIYVHY